MATTAATQIIAEPSMPQIVITREFDASRELLFRAHTDPELLAQWLGPRRLTMIVDQYDVRDGGVWRFIHRDAEGNEYGFHGVFHGAPTPDGVVRTFEYEGAPDHVSLETLTFEDRGGGRTLVRVSSIYQSVVDRDAVIESGMESGVREGMERLDELLARLAPSR
jgi:uncharacterized protein YndB with AHSA1/START domain